MKKLFLVMAAIALLSLSGMAQAVTIFDTIPSPDPTKMASWGYQATSTSELGDYIQFSGTARNLNTVRVGMVSFAEYDADYTSGGAAYNDLYLVKDANGWEQVLTFNIYGVDTSGIKPAVGSILASKTQTFTIPWAPNDKTNPYSAVTFDFSSLNITLPDEIIFGLAFNTQSYGVDPTGYIGPYCSLNLGAYNGSPFVGTDIDPKTGFVNSKWNAMYGSGTSGVFTVSDAADFAAGYRPSVEFDATAAVPEPMSIMLGIMGLGSIAGLRRLRRNK